jgi:hypothetical protein
VAHQANPSANGTPRAGPAPERRWHRARNRTVEQEL